MFGRKFGGLHGMKKTMNGIMKIKKNPPLEKELEITLEQLYNGAIKCVKIERKVSIIILSFKYNNNNKFHISYKNYLFNIQLIKFTIY